MRQVGVMVVSADCLPVAVAGEGAVAMLHAGWRGLAAGVLEAGVRTLRELAGGRGRGARRARRRCLLLRGRCRGPRGARRGRRAATATSTCAADAHDEAARRPASSDVQTSIAARSATRATSRIAAKAPLAGSQAGRVVDVIAVGRRRGPREPRGHRSADRAAAARGAATRGARARAVEILAAVKYVSLTTTLPLLADAGVELVGENRAQDLAGQGPAPTGRSSSGTSSASCRAAQVAPIAPHVPLIHSVASARRSRPLERRRDQARRGLRIMIEVNVAGEPGKAGIPPDELDALSRARRFPSRA